MPDLNGFRLLSGYFDAEAQKALVHEVRGVIMAAPLYQPTMPRSGKPLSVRMTNCGTLGWLTDKDRGYRYEPCHPVTGRAWPPIPLILLTLWEDVAGPAGPPEACLVNFYGAKARLGSHRDEDEAERRAPVVSVSLGDTAIFRLGGIKRGDPKRRMALQSGDVVVLGGESRLAYHGIDRILPATSDLLPEGGRINLTLRRVTPFHA